MEETYNLAPGNILQNMMIRSRVKILKSKGYNSFIELGSGNGNISKILLEEGFNGVGYDLSLDACKINEDLNSKYINNLRYKIENSNFFEVDKKTDLVISSHVIEHFSDDLLKKYFKKCSSILSKKGVIISLVPSSMKYWGIEDETTGHYRRFEFIDFKNIAHEYNFEVKKNDGLTFPLSNILFGVSNYLVKKQEEWKKKLSKDEQTVLSSSGGARKVMWKTNFPWYIKYIVNKYTMYPFYILQKIFKANTNCMVIYSELQKITND